MFSYYRSVGFLFSLLLNLVGILIVAVLISLLLTQCFDDSSASNLASWVQAVGAVAAIVAGFAVSAKQRRDEQDAAKEEQQKFARAAHTLVFAAIQHVTERLDGALTPSSEFKGYALHGDRTTEVVRAMAELDTSRLPSELLADFVTLRSHLFAINKRISDVFESEERLSGDQRAEKKSRRSERLRSAVRMRLAADKAFEGLQGLAAERFAVVPRAVVAGPSLAAAEQFLPKD